MELTTEQLDFLEKSVPGNFAIYRLDGDVFETLYFSPGLPALNGMSIDEYAEYTKKNASDIAFEEDMPALIEAVKRSVSMGEPVDCYIRVKHKAIGVDWAHVNARVCGEVRGKPVLLTVYTNASIETDIYQELLDNTSKRVFVYDRNTYDILFANKAARESNVNKAGEITGEKCYDFLHGRSSPCKDCCMKQVEKCIDGLKFNRYDKENDKWEYLSGTNINWCGKEAFVLYVDDVTEMVDRQKELQNILDAHEYQLKSIQILQEHGSFDKRMNKALEKMGKYFRADRAYVFQVSEARKIIKNTFEWCKNGVTPQIENLRSVDIHYMDRWKKYFNRHEVVAVKDIESIREIDPDEYSIMSVQGIVSYIEAPLLEEGKLIGFIGTDNPNVDKLDNTNELLMSFAYSVSNAIIREHDRSKLEVHSKDLETVLNNIPVGVSMIRLNGKKNNARLMNNLMLDMYGISQHDYGNSDKLILSRIPERNRKGLLAEMKELAEPGRTIKVDFQYQKTDGCEPLWYKLSARSVLAGNDVLCFSCLSDITAERKAEDALLESRRMYEAASELANLSVWVYDVNNHRISLADSNACNEDRKEFMIPQVIENVPESLGNWISPDDMDRVNKMYDDIANGAAKVSCEYWYKRIDGIHQRCERVFYTTSFDENGRPAFAYGIGMNVTAQKMEEEKYDSLYRLIAKVNPYSLGTFHLNLTKNICGDGQSPIDSVLNQQKSGTVDGYLEANANMVADPDIKLKYRDIFTREKMLEAFQNGQTELSLEYPVMSSKGKVIWVDGFINMVQNPATHDIEAVTYALNVTDKITEENIVSRITEEIYDHIGLIDIAERTFTLRKRGVASNKEQDTPACYDDHCKRIADESIIDEDRQMFMELSNLDNVASNMRSKGEYMFTFRANGKNGKEERKQVQFSWLDGSHTVIISTQTDITAIYDQEQEQLKKVSEALDEAKTANAAKSDFLSRMSHDIRTPLNGIIGMTHIAKKQKNPPVTDDCLKKIDTSSKFLMGLVNDILDMSKAESGKIELHIEPYYMDDFNGYITSVIKPLCDEKNQKLIFITQPLKSIVPKLDVLRINQIYFNLLSNAVKYTPEGGTITVTVHENITAENKDRITVKISDNGIGISEKFQRVLFDPFTQENRNDSSEMRGSGLGLAIVKKNIDAMGGQISVASKKGEGTTFTFSMECEYIKAEGQHRQKTHDMKDSSYNGLAGKHILLCEDHPLNQEIANALLNEKGMIVTTAEDGSKGLEVFEKSPEWYYDAVLMDIRMPIMNGYEAARGIRCMNRADASDIPIIAMTADAFSDDIKKCYSAGMNGHIAKPIDPDNMFNILDESISGRKRRS